MKRFSRVFLFIIIPLFVTSFTLPRSRSNSFMRVVIDAGHGGHDSGCLGSKIKEKDVALAVALKLGKYIEDNYKDVKVVYTRKTDVFVELNERAAIANNAKADIFICIHCNSASDNVVCGPETWVMGLHKSEANLAVAKRENEVVLLEKDYVKKYDGFDPNSPEANIIFSLYQNAFLDQSLKLASLVQQELKAKGRPGRGVKQAGFLVLYKTSMPSILVETGFLTNKNEEKFLASPKGQDDIARSIYNAFRSYKNSIENGSSVNDTKENRAEESEVDPDNPQPICIAIPKTDSDATETHVKNPGNSSKKNQQAPQKTTPTSQDKEDLFFSVQVVLSPKQLPKDSQKFKGEKDIHEEKAAGMFKYCAGKFTSLNDAVSYQDKLRDKGFKDAFVVAFRNGNRISMKEARTIISKK